MSKTRPLFGNDNETLYAPSGNLVCNFSNRTGLLQSSYAHKSAVLSIDYIESSRRIISICRGGTVVEWSPVHKKVIYSTDLGKSVWRAGYSQLTGAHYIIREKEGNTAVNVVKVVNGAVEELPAITLPEVRGTCKQLLLSPSGKILSCIIGKSLLFCRLDLKPAKFTKVDHEVPLISASVAPDESMIATGDVVGKICIWHIAEDGKSATKSTYHWHSHAVECVQFNSDGSMLYSGGHEGVMVIWHINANTKSFLPRFPAELSVLSISADGTHLVAGLANNSFKIINTATLKDIQSISQLHFPHENFAVAQDPATKKLAISAANGTVQFYDMSSKKVTSSLDVAFKNYASKAFNEEANNLQITHVVFSDVGDYLLTVEQTNFKGDGAEKAATIRYEMTRIKFWKRGTNGSFTMTAVIENPHRGKRVTHAIFAGDHASASKGPSFITAGDDFRYMVWEYLKTEDTFTWSCTITGSYKDIPILQVKTLLGRLYVLHASNVVTIWDCKNSYALQEAFCLPYKEPLFTCDFSNNGHGMLGATKNYLVSFDVASKACVWDLKVAAKQIYNDPSAVEGQCCVLLAPIEGEVKTAGLVVVGYENSTPLTVCRFKGGAKLVKAIYADLKYHRNSLVVFKSNGQMQKLSYILKGEKMTDEATATSISTAAAQMVDLTIYSRESGKPEGGSEAASAEHVIRDQIASFAKYLDAVKSYESPTAHKLHETLLGAVLVPRGNTTEMEQTLSGEQQKEVSGTETKMELGDEQKLIEGREEVATGIELSGLAIVL